MSNSTIFYPQITTINASWLNDVNTGIFTVMGDGSTNPPATKSQLAANVGPTFISDLGLLVKTNNLSDVTNTATALSNLGGAAKSANLSDLSNTTTALSNIGGMAKSANLSDVVSVSTARTNLGLGTAATFNVGTAANNVVQLDGSAKLPAVDGSQLTNLAISYIPTPSRIVASTSTSGRGSTNTLVRQFSAASISVGSDITHTPSATLGSEFAINTNGIYEIVYQDEDTTPSINTIMSITRNSTTGVSLIPTTNAIAAGQFDGNNQVITGKISFIGYIAAGTIIRALINRAVNTGTGYMSITRVL